MALTAELENQVEKYMFIVNSCTSLFGLIANITVLIVISCSKSLNTVADLYLLSLASSDLLILIANYPFAFLTYSSTNEPTAKYLFHNKVVDQSIMYMLDIGTYASTWVVTAFTVERYLAICHPFLVQSMSKSSRVRKIIVSLWLAAGLLALLKGTEEFILRGVEDENLMRLAKDAYPYVESTISFSYFFIPMGLVTVMYILIGFKLMRRTKDRTTRSEADLANTRILIMFVLIVAMLFLSWVPSFLYVILINCCAAPKNEQCGAFYCQFYWLYMLQNLTFTLPLMFNPVIYAMMSVKFREAFKVLLSKAQGKLAEGSSFFKRTQSNETSSDMVS